jgi:general secretion pathway protein A
MVGYEQFFGLTDAPFSLAPNPRYLFESASHAAALEQLAYAIHRREPLIVMTGEIGIGKTLMCRTVLSRLDRKTFVSVINNPLLDQDDLLKQMLQDFGIISADRSVATSTSRHDLAHALEDFLSSLSALNAHAVVIIDEAQHLQPEVLEQIRLLSNVDEPRGTMLQIVLAGQQDLEALLARPEMRQFQQRVSRRIRLEPLREAELRSYIDHRLAVSRAAASRMPGADELARALGDWESEKGSAIFTPDTVHAIWRWSSGIPRVVNLLCDRALEAAFASQLRTIDASLIEAAATALDLKVEPAPPAAPVPEHVNAPESPAVESPAETIVAEPLIFAPRETVEISRALDFDLTPAPVLDSPAPSSRRTNILAGVLVLVLATVGAFWYLTRVTDQAVQAPAAAPSTPKAAPVAPSTTPAPAGQPAANAPAASPAVPSAPSAGAAPAKPETAPAPAAAGAATAPAASAPATASAAAAPPAGHTQSFEIVVASFRTEPRAAALAQQVSDVGLKVRRREVGGWLQVLAGPFASREEADAARQRLDQAGLTGSQVVAIER